MNQHSERAHSLLGASSSSRWFKCPGSINLTKKINPKEKTSKYAEEGTAAHELGEHCIEKGLEPLDLVGLTFNNHSVTEEMAQAVKVYVDYIDSISTESSEMYLEERFSLEYIDPSMFGTNDCCIIEPYTKITIVDYKHGAGIPVEAEDNKQLLYYALGAYQLDKEVELIELVIVQPRCDHPDGPIRSWVIGVDDLLKFEKELKDAVRATKSPDAPLHSGSHCKFCPVAPKCDRIADDSLKVAQTTFEEVKDKGLKSLPNPSDMTKEEHIRVLDAADLVEEWIKTIRSMVHKRIEERIMDYPGWTVKKKRGHRKWVDESKVKEELEFVVGEDIYTKKLKTPAQLEKLVGKDTIKDLTISPEIGTKLVKDDRNTKNELTAITLFDEI